MTKGNELYYQYRKKLNKENNTKQAYKREDDRGSGTRNQRYIQDVLGGGNGQAVNQTQPVSSNKPKTREELLNQYRNTLKKTQATQMAAPMPQDNPYLKAAVRQTLPAYQRPVDPITAAAANMLRNNAKGNIDLYNRPQYRQPDGSISTVNSISIGTDEGAIPSVNGKGMEVLIPTIGRDKNGRPVQWTDEQAIENYRKTGENLGKFNSIEDADKYAEMLHRQQEAYYSPENSPLRLNNMAPKPYKLGDAVQRFQQTGEMYISPELKKMMEEAPDTGQGIRSSTQEEVNAAADWTKQRVENANKAQSDRELRTFDRHNPIIAGALQGTGIPSMLTAGEQALARLTGNEEAQKQSARMYENELREAQGLQERHPYAFGAGSLAGNIGTMALGGEALGAAAEGIKAPRLAVRAITGGILFGGSTAAHQAGSLATGLMSGTEFARNVSVSTVSGAAQSAAAMATAVGLEDLLRRTGSQTLFLDWVKNLSSATAGAGTRIGIEYAMQDKTPTDLFRKNYMAMHPEATEEDLQKAYTDSLRQQAAVQFGTAFAMNLLSSTMDTYKTNSRNFSWLKKQYEDLEKDIELAATMRPANSEDLDSWQEAINNRTQTLRETLQENYFGGQQDKVDAMTAALDAIDARAADFVAMQRGTNTFGASAGTGTASGTGTALVPMDFAAAIDQAMKQGVAEAQAQPPAVPGMEQLRALAAPPTETAEAQLPTTAPTTAPTTVAQPSTTGAEMFPQAQGVPGNPYERTAAQKLDTAVRQLQALEYERSQHPSVEQLNDELNSPFAVFENENPEIAQIQTRTGEQKLAALAAQATENQAAQKRDQIQAIYEAGKTQNPDFQSVMDRATMLTEAEKTDAFYRGLTAAAAEAAGIGKEISYGGQQQEEGNYLSGEGSGRNLPLSAGERDGGVPSEAGGTAEGWQNWTAAADPDLRGGREGAGSTNVTLDRGVLAEEVLRTAAPGQVIYPVKDGGTPKMRKAQARINAYDHDITQTPFVSKGDLLTNKGEYIRAFVDPVKRQIGFRINDEQASSDKVGGIHEVLEIANIDGKLDLSEAEDLARHIIPGRYFNAIVKAYQNNGPTRIGIRHAIKEALFDITAGINQFEGVEGYGKVAQAVDYAQGVLYDYFNDVLGGVFDAEYDETAAPVAAAETAAGTRTETTAPSRIVGESPKVEITDKNVSVDSIVPTITEMPENPPEYSSTLYREPAQKELFTLSKDGEITVKQKLNMSGRDFLIKQMKEKGYRDKKNTLAWLDKTADFMDKAEAVYTYIGLDDIKNTKLVIDPRSGNIVLRALVKNGEYPVNIDLTKECTRRIALGKFVDWLSRNAGRKGGKTMLEEVPLTASNLVLFNKILKDEGFDTACLGCFVETRRYRIQEWADSFIEKYNKAVEKNNPGADYFNFADKNVYVSDLSKKDLADLNEALESYKANVKEERNAKKAYAKAEKERLKSIGATKKQIDDVKSELSNEEKINTLVRSNKIYQKKLRVSDLITPGGRTVLHRDFPELESLVLGHYGSNTPKSVELFTPYNYDLGSIQAVGKQTLQDYVAPIGGAREQSFSDSVPTHLMDQMEKTADMAVNKLPDHIYTKVPSEVMLFGLTRRKFNMSIMFNIDPDVDSAHAGLRADGSYFVGDRKTSELEAKAGRERTFVQSFPYDMAKKIQHMPGYSKNCGMIGVGYSYFHIKKMLADPEFGYLIGYHPSGMNGELASASYIEKATSYEPVQNTLKIKGLRHVTGELDGLPSYASWPQGTKTTDNKMIEKTKFTMKDFDMKGNLKKYGGKETMRRFLAWLEENRLAVDTSKASYDGVEQHGVGSFPLYEDLAKTKDYRKTADNYITWCLENDMLPEFYEFADDDNYFNFIYDYTPYDHNTGKYSPQLPVQMIFPDNFFKLANHALNQWNNYMMRQEPKEIPTFERMYNEAVQYSSKLDLSGKQGASGQRDSSGNELTVQQAEYFKDSKVRDAEGNLLRVYHGTNAEFNVFDRSRIGAHGSYEGAGFNFTPSSTRAGGYKGIGGGEGRVMEGYLNITNPLSADKKTMTVRQLAKLIEKIDPTGDDVISNYAQDTRDYGKPSFVRREALYTARQMMNYHDSDVDIYSDLSASGASTNAIIDAYKGLGYDGLIHYDGDGKINTLIAFDSNQFKNIDNASPTENADIRYSSKLQLNKGEDDAGLYITMRSALNDKGNGWEFEKIDSEYDLISPSGEEKWFNSVSDAVAYYVKQTGDDSIQKRIDAMAEFQKRAAMRRERPAADRTKDSTGRKLSKAMQEYMKDSKMRNANGQLKPMFHGSETAGFTVFDRGSSDDKLSLFFSDDPYVSESYIEGDVFGFTKDAPVEDVETFADRVGYFTEYEWEVSEDGLTITDDNGDVHEFNTPEETRDYFVDHYDTSGVYEVYLNITNPLELDAKGAMWNNLPSEYNGKKIDGTNTRAWAAFAYENGYDGVIFRNIIDNGGHGLDDYRESTVAVVFNSNQVKSVHNQNPTENDDIRYSSKLKLRDKEDDYAPTFYSKLQREVENYKGEKIGAASVESYLKGKGVKDEEIKWSGIRTYLEGKKSVNKQDLMQYLRDNEMQIEEKVLGGDVDQNVWSNGYNTVYTDRYYDPVSNAEFKGEDDFRKEAVKRAAEDRIQEKDIIFNISDDYMSAETEDGEVILEAMLPDVYELRDAEYEPSSGTRWEDYKLDGGKNYREVLFSIPGSDYSNQAMQTHWKGDKGVLAHARVQDFDSADGGKVLFIEEIQSDWHNAGQKHGYSNDFNVVEGEYGQWLLKDANGKTVAKTDQLYTKERAKEALMNQVRNKVAPDAPFRNTYTDYVLKNLLRMAAEGDYDYLAWTTGKMQEERWSDEFAEGYRIEYDQQIPKFLKKYGKQWGAKLTEIGLWTSDDVPQDVDSKIHEFVEAIKEYDKDATYESVRSEMPGLVGYAVSWMEEDDPNWDRITGLAREIENAEFMNSGSGRMVPAITVNDAMKDSVLTEGQPMFSTKLNLNGREVELTDREEELMDQLNTSYLDRIDEITQQKDAEIAALQEEMERTVGEEKKKARDRLERLRKQKNDRIAYLEKQWRENTNRRIADLKEKAKNKLGEQHDDMMRRLAKLQAQKDKKIEDILAEHRRQRQDARDKRNDRKLRVKFQKLAQRAVRDSKNKPGMASQRVQELLKDIDLKALGMRDETKWELRRKYQEILEMKEKDENYAALFADRDMKKVERLFKTQINEMSVEDINDLITELSALAHYQENTDRLLKDSQGRSAAEVGRQIVKDLKDLSPLEVTNPVKRLSAKYLRDNLSPERAFNRLSGYKHDNAMKTFYRTQVLDGLTKVKRFEQKADELKQEFIKDEKNKFFLNNGSKQTIPVTDKYGRTAMISPAMRVSLYMASKNTDNLRHIATDGVTVPEPKTYAKGMIEDAYGRGTTLVLDPTDVKAICNGMTDSEKEFATLLKIFFDTYAKDAINETSVDLDGILRATVENYFPITSDKNFLAKSMDSFQDPTLEGWNNLKSRQEGANNKILLEDARQVLQRHIRNTARYHGLAVPMRNWGKVYGYTSHRDEATGTRNSVQSAIKNAWDADTADYIERLIRDDINSGGRKAERGIADAMRSAYAGATLTLNPSVALKQTTSYLMAGSILDSGSLMYGLAHGFTKKDEAYMDSITPWGWARRQGESTIELGDLARKMDPITKNTPNWNQAMDVWTTNRLFLATEESVKKEFKASKNEALHDLKRGDKKYDDAVAERYNQVLWRTQPQYEAAFRPEYLRKTDVGSRTFGMFKTESMQMSGELIDSWGQWRADSMRTKDAKNIYDKHPGDQTKSEYETNDKYRKESAKQFYRTFTSWVASNMLFAIMGTALNIGLLHKGKPYRNEKGEIDWETIAKKTALNFVGSSLGGFFYASTAADIGAYLYGKLSGENPTWYDIEVPGISLMNDAVENMGNLTGVLTNEEANNAAKAQAVAKFALAVAKFTPVGFAENIVNLANSVVLYNQDVKEGTFGKWEAGKGLLKDTSPTKDQYANRAVDAARKGDMATAERALKKTKKANLEKAVGRPITENMYKKIMEDPNNLRNYLGVALEDMTPSIKNVPDHGYSSFTKLREDIGDPERTQNWHHIVEQEQMEEGLAGFKSTQVNNTNNIVSIPSGSKSPHSKISEYYGSVQDFTDGKTVREWLKDKSFEEQWEFGVKQLREYGDLVPTTNGWVFVPDKEKMETKIPMSEGKAKEKTGTQRAWESRIAEAREDGGLSGREVRDAALTMLKDGLTADEAIELYRKNQKSDKNLDKWKGSFEDYLNGRNAIDDAKAIKDSDKKRQKEKRKQAVEDYLRQYHGTEEDELLLWKLAGYGESTFVYR